MLDDVEGKSRPFRFCRRPSHSIKPRRGLPGPWAVVVDGDDNVWISDFAMPNSPIAHLCGVRTETCPPGFKTGDQISPPGGYEHEDQSASAEFSPALDRLSHILCKCRRGFGRRNAVVIPDKRCTATSLSRLRIYAAITIAPAASQRLDWMKERIGAVVGVRRLAAGAMLAAAQQPLVTNSEGDPSALGRPVGSPRDIATAIAANVDTVVTFGCGDAASFELSRDSIGVGQTAWLERCGVADFGPTVAVDVDDQTAQPRVDSFYHGDHRLVLPRFAMTAFESDAVASIGGDRSVRYFVMVSEPRRSDFGGENLRFMLRNSGRRHLDLSRLEPCAAARS